MSTLTIPVVTNADTEYKGLLDLLIRSEDILRAAEQSQQTHPAIKYRILQHFARPERTRTIRDVRLRCE
jgi:hypothetical protein